MRTEVRVNHGTWRQQHGRGRGRRPKAGEGEVVREVRWCQLRLVQRKPNRKKVSKSIGFVSWTGEDSEPWWDKPDLQQTDGRTSDWKEQP